MQEATMVQKQQNAETPLGVDLDGTLVRTDLLYESLVLLFKKHPLTFFLLPFWLLGGKAAFKRKIACRVSVEPEALPYNEPFLEYLKEQRQQGRKLILITASDEAYARAVSEHLGLFDDVVGSTGELNMRGKAKVAYLSSQYEAFDYAGDSAADMPVWAASRRAIVVSPSSSFVRSVTQQTEVEKVFTPERATLKVLFRSLRMHQWVKNLLLFVPLIMAHRVTELPLVLQSLVAFVSFSFCASSVYLFNDLLDLSSDRAHHQKRYRPLASGALPIPYGVVLGFFLLAVSFTCSLVLPGAFIGVLLTYFVITSSYSLGLKRVAVLDIVVLASLYTVRIFAGGLAVDVPVSKWLLGFSLFFFFSLACIKRFSELYSMRKQNLSKAAGRGYHASDLEQIASSGSAAGYLSVLVLALYISSAEVETLYQRPYVLWLLCPLLLYWTTRIWLLAHRGEVHEDPIIFAIRDKTSYVVGFISFILLVLAKYI